MMPSKQLSAMSLTLLAIVGGTMAATTTKTAYPEVIPGPGLPSLAELGLTSADLYTMKPSLKTRENMERSAKYTPVCETYTTGNVDNVIACFNYLQSIGGNVCTVNSDNVRFCSAGDAEVTGSKISRGPSVSSRCSDVATAVQWIFTNCNAGGRAGGSDAAFGNGNLIVGVQNINWG